ncbi:MAG: hypothetical protein RBR58_00250 [Candidatus Humimicrobiaceae bacterium]|jgi:hypothetical protein|nr:hypothetical protein [Candidatus Humimicrobiaceae bacterium]
MKYFKTFIKVFCVIGIFIFIFPRTLFAYLDPGSGSYIIQMIIALVIGGTFGIKVFWRKIYQFFNNLFSRANKSDDDGKN